MKKLYAQLLALLLIARIRMSHAVLSTVWRFISWMYWSMAQIMSKRGYPVDPFFPVEDRDFGDNRHER